MTSRYDYEHPGRRRTSERWQRTDVGRGVPAAGVAATYGGVAVNSDQSEASFQRAVVEAAVLYGWRSCHTRRATVRSGRIATPTSVPGWPDLVLWNPTRRGVLFVELKTNTGRVTRQQQEVIDSLRAAGAAVCIWRPKFWDAIQVVLKTGSVADSPAVPAGPQPSSTAGALSVEDREWIAADSLAERTVDAAERGPE